MQGISSVKFLVKRSLLIIISVLANTFCVQANRFQAIRHYWKWAPGFQVDN